jgi:hypothetical protein
MLRPTALKLLFWQRCHASNGERKNSVAFQVRDVERMFGQRRLVDLTIIGHGLECP